MQQITVILKLRMVFLIAYQGNSKKVTIPKTVTSIGANAFQGNDTINSVIIPDTVTDIDEFSFAYCTKLTDIKISKKLVYIGAFAFCGLP